MKNFFKKLSFVMAAAMVITSLHVPAAKAATKDGITIKGNKNKVVTKKSIFVEGSKVNFDYKIGKHMNKGAKGVWSVSDSSVIKVDKNGVVTAVGTGDATLMLTVKKNKKTGIKKNMIYKVMITSYARAKAVEVPASDASVSLKVGEMKEVMPTLVSVKEGVNSTYKLYATSDNATDVAVEVKDNAKVVVTAKNKTASPATITVFAAQKNTAEEAMKNKYKKEATFTVNVMGDLSVEQAGANKLRVKGKDLSTDAALYVVKNMAGSSLDIKKTGITVNEAKTEALLTAELSKISVGDYVLTYNKKDEVKFSVAEAMVSKIVFTSEKKEAILEGHSTAESKKAKVLYKVYDQFGDDVTAGSLGSNLNVVSNVKSATINKGVIELESENSLNLGIDKISITIVDKTTGVNASDIFVVSNVATVKEVEFKGLYDINTRKVISSVSEEDILTEGRYKLLFNFKDQYGVEKVYEKDAHEQVSVSLISTTQVVLKNDKTSKVTYEGKDYTAYEFDTANMGENTVHSGEVEVHTVSLNHGIVTKGKFQITDKSKVDKLIVRAGDKGVFDGQVNELYFEAYDLNNKPIKDLKTLRKVVIDGKDGDESNPRFEIDYNDKGKVKLIYDLKKAPLKIDGTDTQRQPQPLSFITPTNKLVTPTLSVQRKRFPKIFDGLKSSVPQGITSGSELKFNVKDIIFKDQYGNNMTAKDIYDLDYTDVDAYKLVVAVKEKTENATLTEISDATWAFKYNYNGYDVTADTVDKTIRYITVPLNKTNTKINSTDKDIISLKAMKKGMTYNAYDEDNTSSAPKTSTEPAESAEFTFKLMKGDKVIGEKTYTRLNVNISKLTKFGVEKADVQPASDLYGDATRWYNYRPSVYGYLDTLKVALGDFDFKVDAGIEGNAGTAAEAETKGEYYVYVPTKAGLPTDKENDTREFTVVIIDDSTSPKYVTGTYTYSKAAPKVAKVEKVNHTDIAIGTKTMKWDTSSSDIDLKSYFKVTDQYGKVRPLADEKPYITFIFADDVKFGTGNDKVEVNNNGTTIASVKVGANLLTGDKKLNCTVRIEYPKSGYVVESPITID